MTHVHGAATAEHPRWDGRRVLFDLVDAASSTPCAISQGAIQELSEVRRFKPADLLRCFAAARGRIEAIALAKRKARPSGAEGVLNIWLDDVEDFTPDRPATAAARPR
jgi:hypothetical protein